MRGPTGWFRSGALLTAAGLNFACAGWALAKGDMKDAAAATIILGLVFAIASALED